MTVISLGGSIVAPDGVDDGYVAALRRCLVDHIESTGERLILIVGGGGPARRYQRALRAVVESAATDALDWIGVMATRLNAELIRHVMAPYCADAVVYDPTGPIDFTGSVLVGAGWKPGFSTDFDAVLLAERFGAQTVINLSNIAKVYSADPRIDPHATPLDHVGWAEFRAIVGDDWEPGKNVPFDPVATRKAAELGLRVVAAGGADLANVEAILRGQPFVGTEIGPE